MDNMLFLTFNKAGLMGQVIVIGLLIGSMYAWAVILAKKQLLKKANSITEVFIKNYEDMGSDIGQFLKNPMWRHWSEAPLPRVYRKLADEMNLYLSDSQFTPSSSVATVEKKLIQPDIESLEKLAEREISEEVIKLQRSLNVLATTASVSPLTGLLGTVWGIMVTFIDMSYKGSANIATVAPGISQALMTTILGLIVAIPALIFYNNFNHQINIMAVGMQNFISGFLSQIERRYVR